MNFGCHVFLIKPDHDRTDQTSEEWISNFYGCLELLLSRLSGEKIKINIISCKELDIEAIYSPHTLLIPIVSPGLLNSPTFNEEIKLFHEKAINKSKNNISWNSRIFKVSHEPQNTHFLLDYLSDSGSFDFFHFDTSTREYVIYDDFMQPASEKTFWMRLYDLASNIFKVMDSLKNADNELANITKELNSFSVYLSEVSADLIPQRDAVKRELLRNGYRVLPEKKMPGDLESIMKQVKKDLAVSNMSIHLVGSDHYIIRGTNVSIVDLQNRMASKHFNELQKADDGSGLNFGRIVWVSPNQKNLSVRQRLFIENLKKDTDSISMSDLLICTVEELKTFAINKIKGGKKHHERLFGSEKPEDGKTIYLIHEKDESKMCKKIEGFLEKNGYKVINSNFKGRPDEVRTIHNENLRKCDATLIYYGKENEGWIKTKQNDLLKSLGLGREKPISPQAIIVDNNSRIAESLGLDKGSLILQNHKRFRSKAMEPFLTKLKG
jgi:hypothetical protein